MNNTNLKTYIFRKETFYQAVVGTGILITLYIVSRHNYLVFHTMAEFFSVAVAGSLFLIFWNTREIIENKPLILLGIAYLFIGSIDLVHTLSYKGMGVLAAETGANPATQLWIFARYMESLSLFLFSALAIKRIHTARVMLSYGVVLALGLLSIFYWKNFPVCYVEGTGLTDFKIFSEYIICAILIVSLLVFTKKKSRFHETVFHCMVTAIILSILAELAFTFYVDVFGLSNLFGHYCKILSFYFIYKALIQSGLTRPFATLFRDMEQNRKMLEESRAMFQAAMDHSHAGIAIAGAPDGKFLYVNDSALNIRGESEEKLVNGVDLSQYVSAWRILHFDGTPYKKEELPLARAILYGEVCTEEFVIRRSDQEDRIVLANAAPIKNDHGDIIYGIVIFLDISDRKRAEAALKKSEEKYRTLFESSKDPVYISTIEGTVMDANQAFFSLFGYTKEDLGQLKTQDLYINPDNRAEFIKELNKSGFVKDYLEKLQTKAGVAMDCQVTATVRSTVDGDIAGYQGTIRDISEVRRKQLEKEQLIFELQEALSEVKKLSGLLPICMHCKKIRDDKGYWNQIEAYIHEHSDAEFSHSICRDCAEKYYPDMDIYDDL